VTVDLKHNQWTSWNGIRSHRFERYAAPTTEDELAEAIARATTLRPVGTGKSSADICAGASTLLDMRSFVGIESVDPTSMSVTVRAGTPLVDLIRAVEDRGWEIPCLPDIDNVTVGGALATGTHGTSGSPLSAYLSGVRLLGPDGSARSVGVGDPGMDAARLSLGVLGVISTATFSCRPQRRFLISEKPMRDEQWIERYPEWLGTHDFVRILWIPHSGYGYVILGDAVEEAPTRTLRSEPPRLRHRRSVSRLLYGATSRIPALVPAANTILKRLFFSSPVERFGTLYGATVTKSRGSTLELAEWTCAQDSYPEVFREIKAGLSNPRNRAWAHIPMDVRFVDEEPAWLGSGYGHPAVTMGCVTRHPATADSYRAFDLVESVFLGASGRPHWAKRFRARAETLSALWPRWRDFLEERTLRDPQGKFLTPQLRKLLGIAG
jgi:L-gulonolactone oxidase